MTHERLFELACQARENSYAPYSQFRVGACILADDGRTFQGCNFENSSYGATICAERCAAGNAVAANTAAWPCGICRQVLREFACDLDMPVIVGSAGGEFIVRTLGDLLPESFGPEYLL